MIPKLISRCIKWINAYATPQGSLNLKETTADKHSMDDFSWQFFRKKEDRLKKSTIFFHLYKISVKVTHDRKCAKGCLRSKEQGEWMYNTVAEENVYGWSPSPLICNSLSLVIASCMHMAMRLTGRAWASHLGLHP